ncbi:MAG: DsrE family protein [Pseudomonadota bacterium]
MERKGETGTTKQVVDAGRRRMLGGLGALAAGAAGWVVGGRARAEESGDEMRFPGDPAEHKVVYQLNKADADYHDSVIFSVGEMIRRYEDNVEVAVVAFGPGIHTLAKEPERSVSDEIRERISSLSQYGVDFVACGNTMDSLGWKEEDMVDFARVVQVGAAELMELQEDGYAYIAW